MADRKCVHVFHRFCGIYTHIPDYVKIISEIIIIEFGKKKKNHQVPPCSVPAPCMTPILFVSLHLINMVDNDNTSNLYMVYHPSHTIELINKNILSIYIQVFHYRYIINVIINLLYLYILQLYINKHTDIQMLIFVR